MSNVNCLEDCTINNIDFFNFNDKIIEAKVIKCYDGDTIHCAFFFDNKYQKFIVRMLGYDSPEMKPKKKLYTEKERIAIKIKAVEARDRLSELIMDKTVILICKKFDKYGRILGDIKLFIDDDKTINQIMIEEKHGYEYYGGTKNV
jgi:endonuclease YncB( thermonuclease family)